ncbi:MAG: DNRLRE domain-containing protein [bacterium]
MLSAWSFVGCEQDDPIDGFDLLSNPADRGVVDSTTITTLLGEETMQDTLVATGSGLFLELGQFDDLETRILLRFNSVPDSVVIQGAKLVLNTNTFYADGSEKFSFQATVHRVTAPWDEKSVTYEEFGNAFDPTPIAEAEIFTTALGVGTVDSLFESIRFEFGEEGKNLVRDWAAGSDTLGILIDFESSGFIKEFFSQDGNITQPRLELAVSDSGAGGDTTIVSVADADAYIVNRLIPLPEGPLYVDNIFGHQSFVKFDLSMIPRESTINLARLKLDVIQSNTNVKNSGFAFLVNTLEEPFTPESEVKIATDGFLTSAVANPQTTTLEITITNLVQFWVTEDVENHGILLRTTSPGSDITRLAFHSSQTDPDLAPRLEVRFSSAPN